ncbi:hypothetical protein [Arthrobacter sp. AD-310]
MDSSMYSLEVIRPTIEASLEFKQSAGIFATGFVLSLIGYGLGTIFAIVSASTASSYYSSDSSVATGILAFICFLVALAGSIMTVVGLYRALVKIDALPLHAPAAPIAPSVSAEPSSVAPYSSPQTPTHLIYSEQRTEHQPPVQ